MILITESAFTDNQWPPRYVRRCWLRDKAESTGTETPVGLIFEFDVW